MHNNEVEWLGDHKKQSNMYKITEKICTLFSIKNYMSVDLNNYL